MCAECLEEKHAGVVYGLHLGDYKFRYIGKSINHKKRYKDHLWSASAGGGLAVHNWIRKHGAENIQMTIIETFTEDDLHYIDEREIFHISQARMLYEGNLNLTEGGEGMSRGYTPSAETIAKRVASLTGKVPTAEHRAKISASKLGIPRTAETRAKMSAAKVGVPQSSGHKEAISAAKKGKPVSGKPNHIRWHVSRNIINLECTFCQETS